MQGETPATPRIDAVATGSRMVVGLDPGLRPSAGTDTAQAVDALLAAGAPGRALEVPADPDRRQLRPGEAVERLGGDGATLDYAVDLGPRARALVLDTVDRAGGSRGVLRPAQLAWLRDQLAGAGGRALLVFSHNPLDNTANGDAALAALDATPGVVAVIAGNSHRNRIRPRPEGGYWQISTSSLADFPQQARALRLRATRSGYVLETWMIDHDGRGLAGAARELAYLDAQGGRPQGFAGARRGPERAAVRRAMIPRMRGLGLFWLVAGTLHFLRPRIYEAIMPDALPAKRELVYASGVAEIVGGAGVLHPATRRPAGWWLIATIVAIFPANVHMAVNAERFRRFPPGCCGSASPSRPC